MKKEPEKIESVISEKRIKLHVFEPSQRKIWTIVGKEKEYWIDPEENFCSCQSYYFNSIEDKRECYHLKSVKLAQKENRVEFIKFSDEEFPEILSGIISEM